MEIETKIPISSLSQLKSRIVSLGFSLKQRRVLERNIVYDFRDNRLKKMDYLFRLRESGGQVILTFKKSRNHSAHPSLKIRDEIDVNISCSERMHAICQGIGLKPVFIYEKYRTTFAKGEIHLMIDETPIGNFLEVEASKKDIEDLLPKLDAKMEDCLSLTYWELFRQKSKKKHMLFL